MSNGVIRILIADDHPIVRDGLAMMLSTQPDFKVIEQAENGTDALHKALEHQPDIILLDLEMPEMDGLEVLVQLIEQQPQAKVLVFTAFDTDDRIVGAVQAGAKGYLLKGAPRQEIFNAIRVIYQGGSLLQPIVASKLMHHISQQAQQPVIETLTEREMDVLKELAQGKTNREIASELVISERTVKFHISAILGKLGAGNRTEAVTIAVSRGLIDLSS